MILSGVLYTALNSNLTDRQIDAMRNAAQLSEIKTTRAGNKYRAEIGYPKPDWTRWCESSRSAAQEGTSFYSNDNNMPLMKKRNTDINFKVAAPAAHVRGGEKLQKTLFTAESLTPRRRLESLGKGELFLREKVSQCNQRCAAASTCGPDVHARGFGGDPPS